MLQDIIYLLTLSAARSAKIFWEEIFMPKSQLGGILYIFPPGGIQSCPRFDRRIFSVLKCACGQCGDKCELFDRCLLYI